MSLVDTDAIVRALVTVAADGVPEGVQVVDGRDFGTELEPRLVVVGYSGNPAAPVVEVTRSPDAGSLDDSRYRVLVHGTVVEWDGEEEFPAKRARAQVTLAAFNDALEADRSLGKTVVEAWLAPELGWYQVADADGNAVEVDFVVTVEVFA